MMCCRLPVVFCYNASVCFPRKDLILYLEKTCNPMKICTLCGNISYISKLLLGFPISLQLPGQFVYTESLHCIPYPSHLGYKLQICHAHVNQLLADVFLTFRSSRMISASIFTQTKYIQFYLSIYSICL